MDESKILIIGANGQLGKALRTQYPTAQAADISELNIINPQSVNGYDWSNIETILNTAAYTNVDGAETSEGRAPSWQVNAQAVANLTQAAIDKKLLLVHISTDYVFDGSKTPHTEAEPFSPLSAYGASKAAGDIAAGMVPRHYILRTSWLIGEGKNFVRTMLELGKKGVTPKVVADQFGRPTFTTELVRCIDHILITQPAFGTYNVTNSGDVVSWADLTREIFRQAGYNLQVTDTTTGEYFAGKENIAPRPAHSEFDLSKLQSTGFTPRDWRDDLGDYIKKEIAA